MFLAIKRRNRKTNCEFMQCIPLVAAVAEKQYVATFVIHLCLVADCCNAVLGKVGLGNLLSSFKPPRLERRRRGWGKRAANLIANREVASHGDQSHSDYCPQCPGKPADERRMIPSHIPILAT